MSSIWPIIGLIATCDFYRQLCDITHFSPIVWLSGTGWGSKGCPSSIRTGGSEQTVKVPTSKIKDISKHPLAVYLKFIDRQIIDIVNP